jgi:hypothetical protein
MLHRVRNDMSILVRVIGVLVLVTLVLTTLLITQVYSQSEASDSSAKISLLLKQLDQDGKQILFRFTIPLVADETVWAIPDEIQGDEDEISRYISDIGDDYICFDELAGQAYSIRCTPFSNIVSISYLNQPN